MLIGVLIVYLAIKLVFRYNWNKGLGVALEFEKKHVVNGETVNVVEAQAVSLLSVHLMLLLLRLLVQYFLLNHYYPYRSGYHTQ